MIRHEGKIRAAVDNAIIFKQDNNELPDRRDFVIINLENEIFNFTEDK